jgi:secreted PhoX family phosphatase
MRPHLSLPLMAALMTLAAAADAGAGPSPFETFTPLPASVIGGSLPENRPFLLSSPLFQQRTLIANGGPQTGGVKLGDNWDMNTLNENGPSAGRYLFHPYELGSAAGGAGVMRFDRSTGTAVTIVPHGTQGFVNGDASRWTPFGTYLTAEESWSTGGASTKGRLFEVTNPLAAPGAVNFVQRNVLPRVAHEGLSFDKANNLYFVDENVSGAIYRYTSATPSNGATFFDAGQTSVLKVGAGGAATWVPITDAAGKALPGIPTITDGALTSVDGRAAADVVGGTAFNRPEDLEIQTLKDGTQRIYFGTTDTHQVWSLNVTNPLAPTIGIFFDQSTIDAATGLPVGSEFLKPDNMAIDSNGNIYVVEDIGDIEAGGPGFDIWFAYDANRDGVAEAIGRWASLSTIGAEPTGLYFDPFRPNVAYIDVQHADSDVDRTIEISAVPEPGTVSLLMAGIMGLAVVRRSRRTTPEKA